MLFSVRNLTYILMLCFLTGCGSTPKKDDHVKYVNHLNKESLNTSSITFRLPDTAGIDLRGVYARDDSVEASPILYQGGAGLVGIFAQIGSHSSIVASQRNAKLKKAQDDANLKIAPLIDLTTALSNSDLSGNLSLPEEKKGEFDKHTFYVKPIFYSSQDMTKLSIKTIVWQRTDEKEKKRVRKKRKYLNYKNLIQVYSEDVEKEQLQDILKGDSGLLKNKLSELFQKSLEIAINDISGKYNNVQKSMKTFTIGEENKKKVVRGAIVDKQCSHNIIQDLHSWYIAIPNLDENNC